MINGYKSECCKIPLDIKRRHSGTTGHAAFKRVQMNDTVVAVWKVLRKPGSVLVAVRTGTTLPQISDNHLSRPTIADWLKRPTRTRLGQRLLQ